MIWARFWNWSQCRNGDCVYKRGCRNREEWEATHHDVATESAADYVSIRMS